MWMWSVECYSVYRVYELEFKPTVLLRVSLRAPIRDPMGFSV